MKVVEFSIKQRVLVNMLTIGLFIAGVICVVNLRHEIFPSISTDIIVVTTIDSTLDAPEDVEQLITIPIEDELRDVEEVKEIRSVSSPNLSIIYLLLYDNVKDIQKVVNDVRQKVDQAKRDLPKTAEAPVTIEQKHPFPVIIAGMNYLRGADKLKIKKLADRFENELKSIPGVSSVDIAGLSDREIWVEVDPYRARAFGVALQQINDAIKSKNLNIPGGKIEGKNGEMTIRVLNQINEHSWDELSDVILKSTSGKLLRLRDVAEVYNTFEKSTTLGRVNGKPAITFTVNKQKTGDTILIADAVKKLIEKYNKILPQGVQLSYYYDTSKFVRTRMNTMIRNGFISMILVAVMLLLFMNWRIAILVVIGLLVSFFGTFVYLKMINSSFNMISLFSLILVLGMLVDDAIVVCENVYRHMENGEEPYKATINGTKEVLLPVIGTVSTTIVAFLPLLLTTGLMGKFVSIIPQVVTVALLLSLFEVIIILPSHLVDFVKPENKEPHIIDRASGKSVVMILLLFLDNILKAVRRRVDKVLNHVLEYYRYALRIALRRRWFVLLFALLAFISALMLVKTGVLKFKLFYADYADRITITLEAPPSFTLEDTSKAVLELEKDIMSNMPPWEIDVVISSIGIAPGAKGMPKRGNNQAVIIFDIDEENPKCRRPTPIIDDLRKIVRKHPFFIKSKVDKEDAGPPVGRAITIKILGNDFNDMKAAANEIKTFLRTIPGVEDVSDDFETGKREIHIKIDEGKVALAGGNVASVGKAIMTAFKGSEVSIFRWGNDEVTIRVKYAEEFVNDIEDVRRFRAVNRFGNIVSLGDFASVEYSPGLREISRKDRKRVITIYGDVDGIRITSKEANAKVKNRFTNTYIGKKYTGCSIAFGGEEEETNDSLRSMAIAGIVAFILIFAILAGILNSFVQPFLVLSIIPLGFVGVAYGFMVFQLPLGFMALMGTIGLVGIIVNDSIVMVSFINDYRANWQKRHGLGEHVQASVNRHLTNHVKWASLMKSGILRFRPILLTTVTTVAGMSTIGFTRSGQEQFIAPMALAIICGLSLGTTVTLFITPCVYAALDDIIIFFFGKGEMPTE